MKKFLSILKIIYSTVFLIEIFYLGFVTLYVSFIEDGLGINKASIEPFILFMSFIFLLILVFFLIDLIKKLFGYVYLLI